MPTVTKKKTDEDVAKRPNVVLDLMAQVALREHHAGEKCPEPGRQT
jgi:hypothetical protein